MADPRTVPSVQSLEFVSLVPVTAATKKTIDAGLKTLNMTGAPHDQHVVAASFLADGQPYYVYIHIDYEERRPKGGKAKRYYYVQLEFRERPEGRPPKAVRERKQDAAWALAWLDRLRGKAPLRCIVDVEAELQGQRPPDRDLVALPLTVTGRALPVTGMEYGLGGEGGLDQVRSFRWRTVENGLKVWLRYLSEIEGPKAYSDSWNVHTTKLTAILEEALGQ